MVKGIYCLLIRVNQSSEIEIGKLGRVNFPKGYYVYVGSAQNNLSKRIERHFSNNKKLKWHIDYLLTSKNVNLTSVYYKELPKKEECNTALILSKHFTPISNFGSSDCKCTSHLFRVKLKEFLNVSKQKEMKMYKS